MRSLHFLHPWFVPFLASFALAWSGFVQLFSNGPRYPLLREEEMSDWLLHDIGWKDGRDTSALRMRRDAERVADHGRRIVDAPR